MDAHAFADADGLMMFQHVAFFKIGSQLMYNA